MFIIAEKGGQGAFRIASDGGEIQVQVGDPGTSIVWKHDSLQHAYDHCVFRYQEAQNAGNAMGSFAWLNAAEALEGML